MFGNGFTVPKIRAKASAGRKTGKQPHMGGMIVAAAASASGGNESASIRRADLCLAPIL
jgi:hypothetical protein